MENKYLLDTNIIIYYFNDIFSEENKEIDSIFENNFTISIITKIEFLGWVGFKEPGIFSEAKEFIENAVILHVDDAVADEAIMLRRDYKIKIPDALIAATAKINGFTLITADIDGFKSLGISIHNPF